MSSVDDPAAIVAGVIAARREQLLRLVRRTGRSELDAEDVLHGAVVRLLERANQLRDAARAEAWIGRVVRNAVLDELRRRSINIQQMDNFAAPAPDEHTVPCHCVLHQVQRMRPAHAEILRQVVVEGEPVARAAVRLGITANSAMVRLHRARQALAALLRDHCGTTNMRACNDCGCEERGCCADPVPAPN